MTLLEALEHSKNNKLKPLIKRPNWRSGCYLYIGHRDTLNFSTTDFCLSYEDIVAKDWIHFDEWE